MEAARAARIARGEPAEGGGLDSMDPQGIAPLVVYLASDEAWHVNGRDFSIMATALGLYTIPQLEAQVFSRGNRWTVDEMFEVFPRTLGPLLENPFGPQEAAAK
jgi:hypothetical protein